MIPSLISLSDSPWRALPPGIHNASIQEVSDCFGYNKRRRELIAGLILACKALKACGCRTLFLDGSFVTEKNVPGDFDGCWDPDGVNPILIDPVLLDFDDQRKEQKLKFGGELFPSNAAADGNGLSFLDFFQIDKYSSLEKGIIKINLVDETFG